jgi:hypothetical protein
VEENAQDIADDKNNVKSSNNDEIVHPNKSITRSHQNEKTSVMQHNEITGEQKSHISAVQEGEVKKSVSESKVVKKKKSFVHIH